MHRTNGPNRQSNPNFLPTACDCIIAFRTIDSKSWWFNSGNLCLALNGTFFQQAKGNRSLGGSLKTTKSYDVKSCTFRSWSSDHVFFDSNGKSKFGAIEREHSNVTTFSE
jgi:hypothetical protein